MVCIVHNKGQHSTIKGSFGGAAYVKQMVPERTNPRAKDASVEDDFAVLPVD